MTLKIRTPTQRKNEVVLEERKPTAQPQPRDVVHRDCDYCLFVLYCNRAKPRSRTAENCPDFFSSYLSTPTAKCIQLQHQFVKKQKQEKK